jgi:ligand-binding sensor domain-containing protein
MWLLAVSLLCGCGPGAGTVVAIALHPTDPNILYVVTHEGPMKTRDGGATWHKIFTGVSQSRVLAIGIDPATPSTVYLGTKDDGVYGSYDGGRQWLSLRAGLDDVRVTAEVQQIVFVPGPQRRVFLATAMGVFESDAEGKSWRKRMAGITNVLMVTALAMDPGRPDVLYAGTSGGVYKTTDGARTWKDVNTGMVQPDRATSSRTLGVSALALDPYRPDIVYAGTLDGLYKTLDGGRAWTRIGRDLASQSINTLVIDPGNRADLYVGSLAGVFKSGDCGAAWENRSAGLSSRNVLSLAASRVPPALLYAGTNGGGLLRSRDGATTWEPMPLVVK